MFITYEKNVDTSYQVIFYGSSLDIDFPKNEGGPWENGIFGFKQGVILGIYAKF